jgi:hypothetical protein
VKPFLITLLISAALTGGVYAWLAQRWPAPETAKSRPSVIVRSEGPPGRLAGKDDEGSVMNKLRAEQQPTRNVIRKLFGRAEQIMSMSQEDVLALLTELEKAPRVRNPLAGMALMAAYTRLAELDPAAAMERANALKGEKRGIATFVTMNEWLIKDRGAAISWFQNQPEGAEKRQFLTMASFAFGAGDPTIIADLNNTVTDPKMRARSQRDALRALAWTNPDAALEKLNQIEDEDMRMDAERDVMRGLAARSPDKAVALAFGKPIGDPLRGEGVNAVRNWSNQDPSKTLQWIVSQPESVQNEVLGKDGMKFGFGSAEPGVIKQYAAQITDPALKDQLYLSYAGGQARENPDGSFAQIKEVKDPEKQKEALKYLGAHAYNNSSLPALEKWMATNPPIALQDQAVASYASAASGKNAVLATEWAAKITDSVLQKQTLDAIKAAAVAK